MSRKPYTFDDVAQSFVTKATKALAGRYRHWGVEFEDIRQELWLWLYGDGQAKVLRWLGNDPQQTTRIYRSLYDKGASFCEREKASHVGYESDDIHWYSVTTVEALLPLALDPTFDGTPERTGEPDERGGRSNRQPQELSDLLAMVMDIRIAAAKVGWNVQSIVDYLGGDRPYVGRRRPLSNAQAQAITRESE